MTHGCHLQAKVKDFEEMGWFEILMFYGFREGHDTAMGNDDDSLLIPSLVERTVLPLVTSLVENVWDVMSSRQTRHLSQLVSRLMEDYPTVSAENKNTEVCSVYNSVLYYMEILKGALVDAPFAVKHFIHCI